MTAFPSYTTGTVAVAAGALAIVGTSTIWSGVNARAGDDIVINGNTVVIQDVTDPTHLVIDAWPYATVAAGATYKIIQRSPFRYAGGQTMADVSTLVAAFNTDGFYVFVSSSLTVPDPSLGNNGQYAFQASTGKLWQKSSGIWHFLGVYTGFSFLGAWSGATAYGINQVVTLGGSSYICILAHTNFTPPNATYWSLLASVGSQGIQGITGASYAATSVTSFLIGTGSKTFTTQAGLAYVVGSRVRAASNANPANYMEGIATAYSGTTLTVNIAAFGGSGTFADWNLSIAGDPGTGNMSGFNNLSEVTNVATSRSNLGINQAIQIAGAVDLNTITAPGTYYCQASTNTNGPVAGGQWYIEVIAFSAITYLLQRATNVTTVDSATYTRNLVNNVWSPWQVLINTGVQSLTAAQQDQARKNIGGLILRQQIFTASGTFTTPAGSSTATVYKARLVGGGGGGGGSNGAGAVGGGGCAGVYGEVWFTGVAPSTAIAITIGAGGASGSTAGGNGGTGGDTVIGAPVSVTAGGSNGGMGNTAAAATGSEGGATGGTSGVFAFVVLGEHGGRGWSTGASIGVAGRGGSSPLGAGAVPGSVNVAQSATGSTGYGGGGAGGFLATTAGSPGSAGITIVEWTL